MTTGWGEDGNSTEKVRGLPSTSGYWGPAARLVRAIGRSAVFPVRGLLALLLQQLTIPKKNTDWSWPNDCLILLSGSLLSKPILAVSSLGDLQCLQFLSFQWDFHFSFVFLRVFFLFLTLFTWPICTYILHNLYYMLVHFCFLGIPSLLFLIFVGNELGKDGQKYEHPLEKS